MRIDNRRKIKKHDNIINFDLALLNPKYDNSENPYGDKSWSIDPEDSSLNKIHLYKIVSEQDFVYYLKDLKDLRFYFVNEKFNRSIKTIEEMVFNIKFFYQYLKEKSKYLHLNEIGFNEILKYGNFLKLNNVKKSARKLACIKIILVGLNSYSISVHADIKNNNFPLIKFQEKSEKKQNFYTKEEYINLSRMTIDIINDYFKNATPELENLFIKASFWFIAFCSGFNMKGLQSLKEDSFSILEEDKNTITYLMIGEKNRNNDGFQKAIIKLNKNEEHSNIFIKVVNKLIELSKEISSISKSFDKGFLFLSYRLDRKNQYFRYNGECFKDNFIAKQYFEKHNAQHLSLSARKIRNQYSLEFFNLSKSEEFVAKVMNHSNVETTIKHYMKFKISDEITVKFQLFQELLVKFSNSEEVDWSLYQKSLNIQNRSLEVLIKDLSTGTLDTPMGNCSNKEDEKGNICDSYIKCFSCKNYSLISDKDLWKIYSFKESLEETKKDSEYYEIHYKPIIESINDFISNIDKSYLLNLRKQYKNYGKHPFWKNPIMLRQITTEYEANL